MAGMFALTKSEQRVVIVLVLGLLIGTFAVHYRNLRSRLPATPAPASASPTVAEPDEENATDERR
jgi:hypothetical protein